MKAEDILFRRARPNDFMIAMEVERWVWDPYNWRTDSQSGPPYDPDLHIVAIDPNGRMLGTIDGCGLDWDGNPNSLPVGGWSDVCKLAEEGFKEKPRFACALGASVLPAYRKFGIAKTLLERLKAAAIEAGFEGLVAPVRPSDKWRAPSMSMDQYTNLRLADGRHFDSWVRIHESIGGRIVGSTENSAQFDADIETWEDLSGIKLPIEGEIMIDHAIAPLVLSNGHGTLVEGSLWLLHD